MNKLTKETADRIEVLAARNGQHARHIALQHKDAPGGLAGAQALARDIFARYANTGRYSWGSWVPDIPVTQSLLRHPVTIFDLPSDPWGGIHAALGLRKVQLARLVEEGFVKINLVHYDSQAEKGFCDYASEASILPSLLENDKISAANGIYVNSAFREPVLSHLAGQKIDLKILFDDALSRFEGVTCQFSKTYKAASVIPRAWQGAIFRGAPPAPVKIAFNHAYLTALKGVPGHRLDPVLDTILADNADGKLHDPYYFARFAERLEATHKLVTAPLTGAYGGYYGMTIEDSTKLSSVLEEQNTDFDAWEQPDRVLESRTRQQWFAVLSDIASGRMERFGADLGVGPGRMSRAVFIRQPVQMSDRQFDHFIGFLHENREILREGEKVVDGLEQIFASGENISRADMACFFRAAYDVHERQNHLLQEKFGALMEDAIGIFEAISQMDLSLSLPIKIVKELSRRTDDLSRQADREAILKMREVANTFSQQSRMIVDYQSRWKLP